MPAAARKQCRGNGFMADPYIIQRVYPADERNFISTPAMIDSAFEEGRPLLEPYLPEVAPFCALIS